MEEKYKPSNFINFSDICFSNGHSPSAKWKLYETLTKDSKPPEQHYHSYWSLLDPMHTAALPELYCEFTAYLQGKCKPQAKRIVVDI